MRLIDKLEQNYGRFAIPNVLRLILGMQAITFIVNLTQGGRIIELIAFDSRLIWGNGEFWRLFSYLADPGATSPIWVIFSLLIFFIISEGLEQEWGSFKVNLFVLGGWVGVVIASVIPFSMIDSISNYHLFYASLFFAFATIYPNKEFLLFFIIPVKVKWLAWILAAVLLVFHGIAPALYLILANYFVAFGPALVKGMKNRAEVQARRAEFKARSLPEDEAFHHCEVCGRTEVDDPTLEFRISSDGNEYCLDHLPNQKP